MSKEDWEAEMSWLTGGRSHLRHSLMNQGIDWNEACEEADTIERRICSQIQKLSPAQLGQQLLFAACPYEDM